MSKLKSFKTGLNLAPKPSDPVGAVEGDIYYSDGTVRAKGLWQYKDAQWAAIGAGKGGLDVFIAEDFSSNSASSFTSGQNATFDNGGALGGVLADEEVAPIAGDRSIKYTTNASATASNNDFFYFTPDALDLKQKDQDVGISFFYSWDGSDDLIQVVLFDDTNNVVLTTGLDLLKNTGSSRKRFSASAYIPSGCNAIKIGFHHIGVSESSKVLVFDDVELSTNPFVYKNLSNDTDWESYTPIIEGLGTVTNVFARWKRDGSDLISRGWVNAGTPTGVALSISLPSGLQIEDSKLPSTGKQNRVGEITRIEAGQRHYGQGGIAHTETGGSLTKIFYSTLPSFDTEFTTNIGTDFATGDGMAWEFRVPIAGWTATSEHVVTPAKTNANYVRAVGNGGTAIVGSTTPVDFTEITDTAGAWSGTEYTVQKDNSVIHLTASIYLVSSSNTVILLYKNGSVYRYIYYAGVSTTVHSSGQYISEKGEFSAGDTLQIRTDQSVTLQNSSSIHYLNIAEHYDTPAFLAAIPQNDYQTKDLSGGAVVSTGTVSDLTFNNLIIGNKYHLHGYLVINSTSSSENAKRHYGDIDNGATEIGEWDVRASNVFEFNRTVPVDITFTATDTTVTFVVDTVTNTQLGTSSKVTLEELKYSRETTRFT